MQSHLPTIIQSMQEKLQHSLMSLGFSRQEAEAQFQELQDLIGMRILEIVTKDENQDSEVDQIITNPDTFLQEKYSEEELTQIFQETTQKTLYEYLNAVTDDLSEEKKKIFFDNLEKELSALGEYFFKTLNEG